MPYNRDSALAQDLILACTGNGISSAAAQKAVRALCRYYGGQMVYIPVKKETGIPAERLRGILADAVGDRDAEKILKKIMALYGCQQVYIPMENRAFRKTVALEIYERLGKDGCGMSDITRDYHISFTLGYRLWKLGQSEKLRPSMPYLPFLEIENNNPD